jgi:hypothetical protein
MEISCIRAALNFITRTHSAHVEGFKHRNIINWVLAFEGLGGKVIYHPALTASAQRLPLGPGVGVNYAQNVL